MSKEKIILASGSPRRRELLAAMGVQFEVVTADLVELDAISPFHPTPADVAQANACAKAEAIAQLHPDCWVLGTDTVVAFGDRLFGKPATLREASIFLQALSGQKHDVITGCVLIGPDGQKQEFHDTTEVTFHELSPELIERYLSAVLVLDKAGAYALQEHGDWIIERVEGSRNNVIGLPTELIERVFKRRGLL